MGRIFLALGLLLIAAVCSSATTVTGTVKDVNGIPYAGARLTANLANADGTTLTAPVTITIASSAICQAAGLGPAPCQQPFPANVGPFTLDGSGSIPGGGITLIDTTLISPASKRWLITVNTLGNAPPIGTGPQTCSALPTITGGSVDVSASFSACPAISAITATAPAGATGTIQLNGGGGLFSANAGWRVSAGEAQCVAALGCTGFNNQNYRTNTTCSGNTTICGSNTAGTIALSGTTVTINTTAALVNSIYILGRNDAASIGVTCNTATVMGEIKISAVSPGTSFTIQVQTAPATNSYCISFWIINPA